MVSSSMDKTVKMWENREDEYVLVQTMNRHKDFVSALAVSNSNNIFVSGSFDKTAILWKYDPEKSKVQLGQWLNSHKASIMDIDISEDDTIIVTADQSGIAKVWKRLVLAKEVVYEEI